MNIVILGNIKHSAEQIKAIASMLTDAGISVRYPSTEMAEMSQDSAIAETFARIDWANVVIAVPKEGLEFTVSTMTEIIYAKHIKKPVLVYYE